MTGRAGGIIGCLLALVLGCAADPELGERRAGLGLECLLDTQCNDDAGCTEDHCVLLNAALSRCEHTAVNDPLCCEGVSDCAVANGCQTRTCEVTTNSWKDCVSHAAGGEQCCEMAGDCAPFTCHAAACDQNQCMYTATPAAEGCCDAPGTCPAGNACQTATCTDNTCGLDGKTAPGCCKTVDDCPAAPPDLPCPLVACMDNVCHAVSLCDGGVPDAPPPPLPDAPEPMADARPADAAPPPPDARPPDAATPVPDAAVPVPDAPEPVPDAPLPPDAPEPTPDAAVSLDAAVPDAPVATFDAELPDAPVIDDPGLLRGGGGCGVAPGDGAGAAPGDGAGAAVVLVALLVVRRRRRGALLALVVISPLAARAQTNIDAQLFRPAATSGGVPGLDAATVPGHLVATAALSLAYTIKPLVLQRRAGEMEVVARQLDAQVAVSLGLWRRVEIGLLVPLLLDQTEGDGVDGRAIGDLRLELKALPLRSERVGVAVVASLGVPAGGDGAYYSDGGLSFRPRLVVTGSAPPLEVTGEAGLVLHPDRTVTDVDVGTQLSYGLSARASIAGGLGLFAALSGLRRVGGDGDAGPASPMQLLGGPELRPPGLPLEVALALGRGLNDGYGAPELRGVLVARYLPRPTVRPAALTRPPAEPVATVVPVDGDGDGVLDGDDGCPAVAGPRDNGGCPWPDRDGDGVADGADKCPELAGRPDLGGCPDVDSDGDGLVDRLDRCPNEAETFNGEADEDGCPEQGLALAVLTEKGIEIKQQIFFQPSSAIINPRSFRLLAAVAQLLRLHPEIARLRIEGHTDARGPRKRNLALSQARADAVKEHLVGAQHIEAERLETRGFGPDRPIADNRSAAGRAKNRRSEFVIVERKEAAPP